MSPQINIVTKQFWSLQSQQLKLLSKLRRVTKSSKLSALLACVARNFYVSPSNSIATHRVQTRKKIKEKFVFFIIESFTNANKSSSNKEVTFKRQENIISSWNILQRYISQPKVLCKPHYGNSHLETGICKWEAPHWGILQDVF